MNSKVKNEIGNRYGKLVVISPSTPIASGNGSKFRWICQCDCGNTKIVTGADLRQGDVKSCGCLKKDKRKDFGESSFNRLYRQYKKDAEKRNKEFHLSKDDVRYFTSQPCFYCGQIPDRIMKAGTRVHGYYLHNGIDRVDNRKGYTTENCVPCCWKCNIAKRSLPVEEFKTLIINIYNHWANSS